MGTNLPFQGSHFAVNNSRCWFTQMPLKQAEGVWDYGFELTSRMGVHWDRVLLPGVFSWNVVERIKGTYDWTYVDTLVKAAQRHQINLLPVIWPFAAWDQEAWANTGRKLTDFSLSYYPKLDAQSPVPPRYDIPHDMNAYVRWVEALVRRYSGDGADSMPGLELPIKFWEVGNEVGAETFWPQHSGVPGYTEVLKNSYLAIKRADPDATVAIEGWAFSRNEPFFRHAIETGLRDGQQYFDIINLHSADAPLDRAIEQIYQTKAMMQGYGVDFPMWNTEWGTYSGSPPPRPGRPPFYLVQRFLPQSARYQAAYEIKGLTLQFHLGVERVFAATLGDIKPPGVELAGPSIQRPPEAVFTHHLIFDEFNRPGKPLLMYYSLRLFMERLDGFTSITRVESGPGNNVFRYDFDGEVGPTPRSRFVMWNDTGGEATVGGQPAGVAHVSATIADSDRTGFAKLTNGEAKFPTRRRRIIDGHLTLRLTEEPLLVEFS